MFEVYDVALIAVIVGLVEVLKKAGLPKRFLPLASLFFGIATSVFYIYPTDLKGGIIVGIMIGLSASGLYSSTKNTIEKQGRSE
ncbi:MAG TPA: hypothetical protein VK044_11250 [Virgibacillus sp.]|nr:hypothetical protein [Virgibacillus sp.]